MEEPAPTAEATPAFAIELKESPSVARSTMRFPVKVFRPVRVVAPAVVSTFKSPVPLMMPPKVRLPMAAVAPIVPRVFSVMLFERV